MSKEAGLGTVCAAVLTGGLGTRLRSAVPNLPKGLAPVAGRPFLSYVLDNLEQTGVRNTVLLTGYGAGAMRETLGDSHGSMKLTHSEEPKPMGTGGAVGFGTAHLQSDPVLILNGDSFVHTDLRPFYQWFMKVGAPAALLLAHVEDASRFGRIQQAESGRITSFEEKRPGGAAWINAGIYLLSQDVLKRIPKGQPSSLEQDLFPALATAGELWGFQAQGAFLDIGTPESYSQAEAFLAQNG